MQKPDSIRVRNSVFSCFVINYSHFKKCFENRRMVHYIKWAINLALLSYQSIVCSQMSVSEIRFKADAITCVLMSTLKL